VFVHYLIHSVTCLDFPLGRPSRLIADDTVQHFSFTIRLLPPTMNDLPNPLL